jgi:hypothetical protein
VAKPPPGFQKGHFSMIYPPKFREKCPFFKNTPTDPKNQANEESTKNRLKPSKNRRKQPKINENHLNNSFENQQKQAIF